MPTLLAGRDGGQLFHYGYGCIFLAMRRLVIFVAIFLVFLSGVKSEGAEVRNNKLSEGTQQASINGVKLNVLVRGSGVPMVLLHGFGASVDTWRNLKRVARQRKPWAPRLLPYAGLSRGTLHLVRAPNPVA